MGLGCFVCWSFSVLMVRVRVGVDWDILGDGRKFGDGGMAKTPKKTHKPLPASVKSRERIASIE